MGAEYDNRPEALLAAMGTAPAEVIVCDTIAGGIPDFHLPQEKRQAVLLYYFFNMTDVEIAEAMKIPRSTVQYRRTSSFELLKRYLEERADEWND